MTTDISVVRGGWDPTLQQEIVDEYEYDGGNSSSRLFERSRIKALAGERESVQKKTFQKWVNSHLVRCSCRIGDLYVDLRDGKMLIKLLEILSGERLPRPTKGKMRIHCLENVDKALQFLREQRVHLENMGSHDIVDGNPRLSLGLIWTIILRFQIQDITIEETDNQETKSAKDALLLWCQMKTAGYHNVNVRNFTTSWRDGLAFNAIIHKHRPDLIQFDKLSKSNAIYNLNNSFNVAEDKLGLTKLLDAEDIFVDHPDEKSIITYVVTYYHYFSKMKQETVQGKRIGKVVGIAMENDRMIHEYESLTSDLLRWIEATIEALGDRHFANSLVGVQSQLSQFSNYRTVEKPPKFVEKGNLEVLLFTLQSKMRANNQKPYTPKEGKMISDINKAWERLEKAEHERELALREELIRQEKLEQLAARFNRKASMRETWLSENQRLVSQDNFGFDLAAVEAAAKKHEAIETDIFAYEERVQAVMAVSQELEAENYHDIDRINARKDNVLRLWNYLLELLKARRLRLELSLQLQQNFQEMLYILDSMEEIKMRLLTDDYGKHLMGVEDLLQKHSLVEADINVLGERVKAVVQQSQRFLEQGEGYRPCDPTIIIERVQQLEDAYAELVRLAVERRARLEESRNLWQFYWDMADEENWIKEKEQIVSTGDIGHDLTTINLLLSKHKALENEIQSHEPQLMSVAAVGDELIRQHHFGSDRIKERLQEILGMWNHLLDLAAFRRKRLEEAVDYHQLFADADDIDIWMLDTLRLVSSEDVGRDEANVQSLLKKHKDVTDELKNYATTIEQLHQQASQLGEHDSKSPEVLERLASIDSRYKELLELAKLRKQRLLDALSLYKLFSESDGVEQWIGEKNRMLETMVPAKDIEDVEIMKHRYDGFDKEMNANASRVAVVNQLARQLLHVEHPNSEQIVARQNELNQKWAELREKAEGKRDALNSAHGVQTFHIECRETVSWIEDKKRILQQTDSLEMDLTGVMTLQRRLSGMERDLAAIQAKLDALEKEAQSIEQEHPEEAAVIRERITQIHTIWEQLTQMLKERDAKLEEAGDLHRFLRDLDHFQTWLTKTQTDVASEDTPTSLADAEKLLTQHQNIKEEIDNYTDDYQKMMEYGERLTSEAGDGDTQYMFLRERLNALKMGWEELHQMWANRQNLLSNSLNLQVFDRDARQAEVLLSQQEHILTKDETPTNFEQAENMIKRHEAFMTTMEANDDKINSVTQFAGRLVEEGHFAADKVKKKADAINERRNANRERANQVMDRLKDQLQLQMFLQDREELVEWVQEKHITAQDETYRSAKTVHSKWTRHQAFEAEIASNKDRLQHLQQAADELIQLKPELAEIIKPKVTELCDQFEELETTTKDKGERLFDANREVLIHQTCDDIDSWMNELEKQIESTDTGCDLASVNILMQKQQMIETQMAVKARQVTELDKQAEHLQRTVPDEKMEEIKFKKEKVAQRFAQLKAPLNDRQRHLEKKKEAYQFRRDVEDEKLWIAEKMPQATSSEYGNSLFNVHMLKKKNQSLRTEIENHEPRINSVCNNGQKLIDEGHEDSAEFIQRISDLSDKWRELKDAVDERNRHLLQNEKAQQYFFDATEAESWMSEQELYMMVEDRGKDEISAQNLMKKHESLEHAVEDYADAIRQLGETARQLINDQHALSDQIAVKQSQVDKLYAGLKDLAGERRAKLDEALQLFMLNREVDDLEQWIAERELVAGSHELGQDYDHVTLLWERFKEFARDTETIGSERVAAVNGIADSLIATGHSDAATIAEWKDGLNEVWQDLLELIETRTQMLAASRELHKFFHDCKDVLGRILEKQNAMSDELGRDAGSVSALQRKHGNFIQDLSTLQSQVAQIQDESSKLQASYAGDKAREITNREAEVVAAWNNLQSLCDGRKAKLEDTGDLFKFFNMVRTLMIWMDDVVRQMNTPEKPRDVSGVELLMNNHQSLKAEIDTREDNLTACLDLGKDLLARNHYASVQIKEKLLALTNHRNALLHRWEERWENLQLILEVYQFARDAAVAEAWLIAQEPYLMSQELGHTIDDVENLIKKHEAFEKSAAAQEERFSALQRLTTSEQLLGREFGLDVPVLEFKHELIFIPEYPPSSQFLLTKPKKHIRSQSQIVREIILDSDKFYKPARRYRREKTSTGTTIIYPGTSSYPNKKKYVRSKSFLWDSEWNSSSKGSQGSTGSQPVSPCVDLDDIPVFEDDISTSFEKKTSGRLDTLSNHRTEQPLVENNQFVKCVNHDPIYQNTFKGKQHLLSELDYVELLPSSSVRISESQSDDENADDISTHSPPPLFKKDKKSSSITEENHPILTQNLLPNTSNHEYVNIVLKSRSAELMTPQQTNHFSEKPIREKCLEIPSPIGSDEESLTGDRQSLDLESSISNIRKLHLQIDALTEDLINTSPQKKRVDPNDAFLLAERCTYEEEHSNQKFNHLMQVRLDYDFPSSLRSSKSLPQSMQEIADESYSKRKRSRSSLGPKDKFQKTSNLNTDSPNPLPILSTSETYPSQGPSLSADNLTVAKNSSEFELKELKRREQEREEEERRKQEEAAAAEAAKLAKATPVTSPDEPPSDRVDGEGIQTGEHAAGEEDSHVHVQKPARMSTPEVGTPPITPTSPKYLSSYPSTPTTPKGGSGSESGTLRRKERSRSKSPFRSFRWKKSTKSPSLDRSGVSDDDHSYTEQRSPGDDEFEGTLIRKHEWESTTKKASNRSWDKLYMVVRGQNLVAYKDQKSYKAAADQPYKGEPSLDLRGASVQVASEYTKKKHVFRVKSQSGADFLFQAKDDAEMLEWVSVLNQAAQGASGASTSRAQTLPAPTQAETKRRSFFTLKKN
ncbi:spectrin beta chain isoform X2 [Athalia rosae]|uniref:spectrin beta chain isoform X2 n=1 Tax=Athalia rosae TaxID=37344 RepID=UPI0020337EE7|nr:spectrin beta chain isoform X2 [Athalia rosae]